MVSATSIRSRTQPLPHQQHLSGRAASRSAPGRQRFATCATREEGQAVSFARGALVRERPRHHVESSSASTLRRPCPVQKLEKKQIGPLRCATQAQAGLGARDRARSRMPMRAGLTTSSRTRMNPKRVDLVEREAIGTRGGASSSQGQDGAHRSMRCDVRAHHMSSGCLTSCRRAAVTQYD